MRPEHTPQLGKHRLELVVTVDEMQDGVADDEVEARVTERQARQVFHPNLIA